MILASGAWRRDIVESAFSLLKRDIVGTSHKVSAKHLTARI
jgi:hypothetical protein